MVYVIEVREFNRAITRRIRRYTYLEEIY